MATTPKLVGPSDPALLKSFENQTPSVARTSPPTVSVTGTATSTGSTVSRSIAPTVVGETTTFNQATQASSGTELFIVSSNNNDSNDIVTVYNTQKEISVSAVNQTINNYKVTNNNTYGDSNVVTLLSAFGSNTITTTGLITGNGGGISNVPYANVTGTPTLGNIATTNYDGNASNVLHGDGTWSADTTTYGNSNVVTLLSAFGSNTITTTGNVSVGNITATNLGNIVSANLDGNVSNLLTGNGTYVAIPVVPTVGNIATINLDGNVSNLLTGNGTYVAIPVVPTVGNIATINLTGSNSNVLYGNGVFAAVAGGGNGTPGGSNTQIQFNDSGNFGANSGFTFDSTTGNISIPGTIISGNTITIDNRASGNGADINLYSADDILIQARDRATGSTSEGGDINIFAGDSAEDGDTSGGDVVIEAGDGGASNLDYGGEGGFVRVEAGQGGAASTEDGGEYAQDGGGLTLRAGDAGNNNGNIARGAGGGDVFIESGDSTSAFTGGNIYLTTGVSGDGSGGGTWTFDGTGNLTLPTNGSLNLTGGGINQASNETLLITTFDDNGIVSSSLELSPGDTTRLEQWSSQQSDTFTTADWTTGVYINQGGQGAIQFTGAANIIAFVNSLDGVGHIYYSVNGGPQLVYDGTSDGGGNITFYTPTLPATDPTVVTSFEYFYSYKSGFEIVSGEGTAVNIYGGDADITLQTTGQQDINLDSSGDVILTANSTVNWTFATTGNLTLPGNTFAVNYANGDQVSIGGGGNTGNVTFNNINVIGTGNLKLQPDSANANAYLDIFLTAGPDIHIAGNGETVILGTDDFANVAVNVNGNVSIQAGDANGTHTWNFDTTGNLILAGGNSVIQSIANSSSEPLYPNVSTMVFTPDALLSSQSLVLDPTGPSHIHLRAPGANIDEPDANIFLGGEASSFEVGYYNGNVPNLYIHSGGNTWTFDNAGNLTLPQGTTISDSTDIVTVTLDQFTDGGYPGPQVFTKVSDTLYELSSGGPYMTLISSIWRLKISTATYYDSTDLITWSPVAGVFPTPVGTLDTLATMNLGVGGNVWNFSGDGNLTLPSGGIIHETNIPDGALSGSAIALKPIGGTTANQQLLIYPTAADGDHIHMTSGNLYATELFLGSDNLYVKLANTGNVVINSNDGNSSNAMWTFDTAGNLTLPGNTFAVNYANGTQVSISGGNANTGNVTFSDQIVLGTGSNDGSGGLYLAPGSNSIANSALQYLRVRGGDVATHIHLDTGNNQFYDQYFGDDAKYVKLANTGNVVIGTDDANGNQYSWSFGTDGNLTTPSNLVIGTGAGSGSRIFQYDDGLEIVGEGANSVVLMGWTANISAPDSVATIAMNYPSGGEGNILIAVGNNATTVNYWLFDNTGNTTFPRNIAPNTTDPILTIVGGANPTIRSDEFDLTGPANLGISALNTIFTGSSGSAIKIYPDDGEISSTANLQIWANSGGNTEYSWTFDNAGTLTLPQGSQISETANTSVNITANANTWAFGVNGTLTLPGSIVTPNGANAAGSPGTAGAPLTITAGDGGIAANTGFNAGAGGDLTITAGDAGSNIGNQSWGEVGGDLTLRGGNATGPYIGGNVAIYSGAGPTAPGAITLNTGTNQWTFGGTGNLTLPNSATIIAPNVNDLTLRVIGEYNICTIQNAGSGYSGSTPLPTTTTGGTGSGMTVNFGYGISGQLVSVSVSDPGTGYSNGDVIGVSGGTGTFVITKYNISANQANNNTLPTDWTFGTDGNLTLPTVGSLVGNLIVPGSIVSSGASPAPYISGFSSISALTLSAPTLTNGNSNVTVNVNSNLWNFDSTGNLTIPGSSGGFIKTIANASIGVAAVDNGTNNPAQLISMTNAGAATSIISAYATNATIQTNATGTLKTWSFDNAGNLTLPGNTFAVNYANGTQVPVGVTQDITSNGAMSIMTYDGNLKYVNNATVEPSTGNIAGGNLSTSGNIAGVGLNMSGNAVIGGNLTVNGTLTYINSTTLSISDPIINLQTGANGAAPIANSGKDVGTALNYYDTDAKIAWMGWDVSNAEIAFGSNVGISSEVVTFTSLANIRSGNASLGNSAVANYFTGNFYGTANLATYATTANAVALANVSGAGNIASLNTDGNSSNILYGNGVFASAPAVYGNSNVATFLGSYGSNTMTTTGNVSVGNIIGNGQALTGLTFGNITTFTTAGLTTDELYLQATTRLNVTASGSSGYLYDQYGVTLNPAIYVTSGQTLAFNLNVSGHPFLIQTSGSANYSTGLVHVDTAGTVLTTTSAQGQIAGTLYWKVPYGITGNYKYQCSIHGGMNGNIVVSDANIANIQVGNALVAGTVYTNAQPNITSVGTLTSISVSGNANVGNLGTAGLIVATGNVTGGNLVTGGIVSATGNITGNFFIGNGNQLTSVTALNANVSLVSNNQEYSPLLATNTTGNLPFKASGGISWNPSTYGLTAGKILLGTGIGAQGVTGTYAFGANTAWKVQSQNGTNTDAQGQEIGRFGSEYTSGATTFWDSYTSYYQGSGASSGWMILNAAGNSVANVTGTGIAVTGTLSANGNVTVGNLIGPHANGNSNVNIATANGNVTITAVGNTTMTVTGTGANITGTLNVTGNITGNTNGFAIGYLNIPQVAAANATLALTDAGKHYYSTTAGNLTLTIPLNSSVAFATGTAISVVVQAAGNVLVNAASGVTLYMGGNSTAGNRVISTYGMATLMKVATNTWFINGTGVA